MNALAVDASPLDDVYAALLASLQGTPPSQTIDLLAAAQRPALAPLRAMLGTLRISGSYTLQAAAVAQTREAVTLTGTGTFGLPGATIPAVPIAATLTVTASGADPAFELALAVTAASWTFASTFPTLPPTLVPDTDAPGVVWSDTSVLAQVAVDGATFIARSGESTLRLAGRLKPSGPLAEYSGWLTPWPLALDGELTLGIDATKPPALDVSGIAPGATLELPPLPAVRELGIGLRSVTGLDVRIAQREAFSELDLVGTVRLTDTIAVRLSAPLQVSSSNWRLSAQIEHGPPLSGGLAAIASLFEMPESSLTVPPGLSGFDTFRLTDVEAVMRREGGAVLPNRLRTLAVTIASPEPWTPPIPGLRLIDVGTRWLLSWTAFDDETLTPVVSGSVFGSIVFGSGENAPTLDLVATLPHFVLTGSLREDTPIDVAAAFETLLGRLAPPVPEGMKISQLGMLADPSGQTYGAAATITMDWKLPFFHDLTLTQVEFHVEARQTRISGGIGGRLALGAGAGAAVLALDAELPPGPAAGWVFSGGFAPGPRPTVGDLISLLVGTAPEAFRALVVERLEGRLDTGEKTWSLAGAVLARFDLAILDTTVRIAAGAEIELAVQAAGKAASGRAKASFQINRLAVELAADVGIADPSYALKVKFGETWLLATISWREAHDAIAKHRVVALRLGGITLGEILEELVRLAAPTLGFRLESPWDELLAIDLSRFTLTIDPTEKLIELTYAVKADLLLLLHLESVGVRYRLEADNSVELIVEGDLLGRPYRGPKALRWDVVRDPPPELPGKGSQLLEVRYLALGQRIRLPDPQPTTVSEAITRLRSDMTQKPGTDVDPLAGGPMIFDPASGWLAALDLTVMGTVDVALVFSDPNVYGLALSLHGERAGPLAGLKFEILYRRLAGGIGMFRAELRLPEAYRHIELGEVSLTLGVVVVEVYTNGNFLVDLGFPYQRSFDRSFAVEVFPFIGRGGIYFGVLNGTTSRRVPAIVGGSFTPVLELGLGLAVGVGKDLSLGPLSGGIYVEVAVVFQGVLAWYRPEGDEGSERYHYAQGIAAIEGRLYGEVDFAVVKASVSVEAYAQVSVAFEAYRATIFALEVSVDAEAEIEILGFSVSFSFGVRYNASFTVGSDAPAPWTLAAEQPSHAPLRRVPARLLAVQQAAASLAASSGVRETPLQVFGGTAKTVAASLLPVFTIAGPAVAWGTTPSASADPAPAWRVAFALLAKDGSSAGARTALAARAPESTRADPPPAAVLIEALLRRALATIPGNEAGKVTAGGLALLAAQLADPEQTHTTFSLDALKAFFKANIVLEVSGVDGAPAAGGMALPVPPFVTIALTPGGQRDLTSYNRVGPLYSYDAAAYMASFSPVTDGPGKQPADDPTRYQSIASGAFCDWCLMVAREAVRQASGTLAARTVAMADGSLDALAADEELFPRDTVAYVVRAGDTIATVAAYLGTTVAELEQLNPTLAGDLATAAAGDRLSVIVGVTGATLAIENATVALSAQAVLDVARVRVQVRARDSLSSVSRRLYGAPNPGRLLTDAKLAGERVLLAGATVSVPQRSAVVPGLTDLDLVAGIVYVRYFADLDPPLTEWYAQRIADLNVSQLETLTGLSLPAELVLTVPAGSMNVDTTTTYTTIAGDTLLQIGAALSLAQSPSAYADPRWIAFLAQVTPADGVTVPGREVAILSGETFDLLAARLLTTSTTLLDWLAAAPVLAPLSVLTITSLPFAAAAYPTLAAVAAAAGLTVAELATRPEMTGKHGLFDAGTPLTLAQLPAQTVEKLVAETCSGARLSEISHQVSRMLLSGVRLPAPVTDDQGHVRATGPLTALAELSGQQLPAPQLDGTTALSGSVTKTNPDDRDLDWLVLNPGPTPGAITYSYTNTQLAAQYPAAELDVTPQRGPIPIPVAGEVPRTYGLDHRVELQSAMTLAIPGGSSTAGGNPTLWPLPAAVLAKARAGDQTPFDLLAARHTATDVAEHDPISDCTFATRVALSLRRVRGVEHVYELLDAEAADRGLLLALALDAAGTPTPQTQVALAVAPVPGAADPNGLAVMSADPQATFLIRTDMATDVPLLAPPAVLTASLGQTAAFLQLLWQGSGTQPGTWLRFATVQGDDLPVGAIAQDGTVVVWVIAISRRQQATATAGRTLLPTNNCALVAPGLDATQHALYLEAHDVTSHPGELVKQAIVPPGAAGVTMTIPRPPDPGTAADAAQARLAQRFSLLASSLSGTYVARRTAPPLPPLREDGQHLPLWIRRRQARAARLAAGDAHTAADQLAPPDPVALWRYEQVAPVASFGPPSVAPDVPGLPPASSDPYRGFGAGKTLAQATFTLGFADLLGNVSSEPFAKQVTATMGYTDPLIGVRSLPASTSSWSVVRAGGKVTIAVSIGAQPAAAVPTPGGAPQPAADTASRHALRFAQAYLQLVQPTLSGSILITLAVDATSKAPIPQPLREGTAPLIRYAAAGYLYASAAAALLPAPPTGAAKLADVIASFGVGPESLATVNAGTALSSILVAGEQMAATATTAAQLGDSASSIVARVPAGWPRPTAADLLSMPANADGPPLRTGAVLDVPSQPFTIGADAPRLSLAEVAAQHSTTAVQLAIDNTDAHALSAGFAFTVGERTVTLGPGGGSFADVVSAFAQAGLEVALAELAAPDSTAARKGIFAEGAQLQVSHAVAGSASTLASLAGTRLDEVAATNVAVRDLYPAGTVLSLGAWTPAPLVPAGAETLAEVAARLATSAGALLAANASLTLSASNELVIPGAVVLPGAGVQIPYAVLAGDTLTSLARQFATDALALAQANRRVPRILVAEVLVTVQVAGHGYSTTTAATDTLETVYGRLHEQSDQIDFAAVVAAVADVAGVLAADGLLVCPAAALQPKTGTPPAKMTAAAVTAAYGAGEDAFAEANAALVGVLAADVTLTAPSGETEVTVASDTLNAVVARFLARGVTVDLQGLLRSNAGVALYRGGARALLPPPPAIVSSDLGSAAGPFPGAAFPLVTTLRLQRDSAVVDPSLKTVGGDGPVERADAVVPAPSESSEGKPRTLDAFIDACLAALPALRLATADADAAGGDLWAVDFGPSGIASVALRAPVAYPGKLGKAPRCLALRPLYHELQSRRDVLVPGLTAGGELSAAVPTSFESVDVEPWARRLLADLDLFLSPAYAAGMYAHGASADDLRALLALRWRLGRALPKGLAPVLVGTDPNQGTGVAAAALELMRACGSGLAKAYDVALAVQYDTEASAPFTDPPKPTARLQGAAQVGSEPVGTDVTITEAWTSLGPTASFATFLVTVVDPPTQPEIDAGALRYVVDALEVDVQAPPSTDGAETGRWISFVRPLAGDYATPAIAGDLGSSSLPIPLRLQPSLPLIIGQTATPTASTTTSPLSSAALWTFSLTYSHEHAGQDEVLLTVSFNVPGPAAPRTLVLTADLAAALWRYAALADPVRAAMAAYTRPPASPARRPSAGTGTDVRDHIVHSLVELVAPIATAWEGHWAESPVDEEAVVASEVYRFRVQVSWQPGDDPLLGAVTLSLDGQQQPSPTGAWPQVAWRNADGSFTLLDPDSSGPHDGALRYVPPHAIHRAGMPTLRIAWPGLNVATIQNGQASLAVHRNEHLVPGVPTNSAFVMSTATITAPDVATPVLEVTAPELLAGADLATALTTALTDLFGSATGPPVTVQLAYGHQLVGELRSWWPVGLYPHQPLATAIAATVAQAASDWQNSAHPSPARAAWSVSLTLSSNLPGRASRPLLVLGRLEYVVPTTTA